jgi:hypothetical protein
VPFAIHRRSLGAVGAALLDAVAIGRLSFAQSDDAASIEQQVERLRKLMLQPERQGLEAIFAEQLRTVIPMAGCRRSRRSSTPW